MQATHYQTLGPLGIAWIGLIKSSISPKGSLHSYVSATTGSSTLKHSGKSCAGWGLPASTNSRMQLDESWNAVFPRAKNLFCNKFLSNAVQNKTVSYRARAAIASNMVLK